jgi:hypothetical protein
MADPLPRADRPDLSWAQDARGGPQTSWIQGLETKLLAALVRFLRTGSL